MRFLKLSAVMTVVLALAASSAFAGAGCSSSKAASASSSCSASMKTASSSCSTSKTASSSACSSELKAAFAGAANHCNVSKATLAKMVEIETTELPSGTLLITYTGKTEDAVKFIQASCEGSPAEFCCPMTRKVANSEANVEIARTNHGAVVLVSSSDPAVTKQAAASFMELASAE